MKKLIKIILLLVFILTTGYVFKENTFTFNLSDTYFIIDYFTVAVYIIYFIIVLCLIQYVVIKARKRAN